VDYALKVVPEAVAYARDFAGRGGNGGMSFCIYFFGMMFG
jgi:hypothetical protein